MFSRERTCPTLIRTFVNIGRHSPENAYRSIDDLPSTTERTSGGGGIGGRGGAQVVLELSIYTWQGELFY
jgi:hypothetical protein